MAQISEAALREIKDALQRYRREVNRASMSEATKKTYLLHSTNFVRWIEGDFEPGRRSSYS